MKHLDLVSVIYSLKKLVLLLFLIWAEFGLSQSFTRADSLRGGITPERIWWDLEHYDLSVKLDVDGRQINGTNRISYVVNQVRPEPGRVSAKTKKVMQIDLQWPMRLDSVTQNGVLLKVIREGSAHFVTTEMPQISGQANSVMCYFSGRPIEAQNPPWDGGFTWNQDELGRPFIANANQGIGASVWWPNKDHPYDEPDRGVDLKIQLAKPLVAVGNGRLLEVSDAGDDDQIFHWQVTSPINNYGVNINVGHYVRFEEVYRGLSGALDCTYWVLDYNLEQAKTQFKQVPMMLEAFEHWFGPYPFYDDGYQLVEVPYLGMEHQSSVTYGNGYRNGYRGTDLSDSGWGMKFDFIIIHESGHEWFANNITNSDVADMWIHEGFTAYSENLFLDYHYGREASNQYVVGTKKRIQNDRPLIGYYGVNHEGSGDMYYKGANILHTLRQWVNDDALWREVLTGLNQQFRHQTISSKQLEDYIASALNLNLTQFWEQYLRTPDIPVFEYHIQDKTLKYRYNKTIAEFNLPVLVHVNGASHWLRPTESWKVLSHPSKIKDFEVDKNFLLKARVIDRP